METPAEKINPLERRLDISIAAQSLEAATAERLKRIARTAKMPGFRPGKIPAKVLNQQYGGEARHEALSELLDAAFSGAAIEQKLRVAGYPRLEPKITENKDSLEFTAIFEVYPEVVVGDLSGSEIERPLLEVGAAEVDKTLEVLRKQRVTFADASRPAQKGDRVVIDFLGKKDGVPFDGGQASDYPFVLGQGMMLPDFENAVEGTPAGESRTFNLSFPDDYFAKDLAGQTVQFEITVKKVQEPKLPELDKDFALMLGIADGDLGKMREEIEGNLKREVKKRIENRVKDQVMEALIKACPITVPAYLLDMEVRRLVHAAREDMEQRGMKTKDMPIQPEWFSGQAQRRVSLGLILAEVVRSEKLEAKPEQVKAMVEEAAQSYENPQEVVGWYYADTQRLSDVEAVAVENNVVEWVLSKVNVTDKAVEFEALMDQKA
ncbi:MAG: hypothetical protein RIR18_2308 [Pseudomonadota bacterium]